MMTIIKRNSLLSLYVLVFAGLIAGVYIHSGLTYIHYLTIYFSTFLIIYAVSLFIFKKKKKKFDKTESLLSIKTNCDIIANILIIITIIFTFAHLFSLGEIPIITAFKSHNSDHISIIRNNISENKHFLWNYGNNFAIKALFPFFALYLYIKKRTKLFVLFLSIGVFYTVTLIAKSPIVTLFVPLLIFTMLTKKFLHFSVFLLIIVVAISFNVLTTNPSLRGLKDEADSYKIINQDKEQNYNPARSGIIGIFNRTVLLPGEVASMWFINIPKNLPYLNGNGYRFIAPLKHQQYRSYSAEMYAFLYPLNVKKGIRGSYNVASFMNDYSNFGVWGLIMSGFLLGVLFAFLQMFFTYKGILGFAINSYPILSLSSSALTTLLFSGGWGMMVLLFLMFNNVMYPPVSKDS
jgi:hypothetical protein